MVLVNRSWGTGPNLPWTASALNASAFKGQYCSLATQQNIPQISLNQYTLDTLLSPDFQALANIISQGTSANCVNIQYSFNYSSAPYIGGYYMTDFFCVIIVQVTGTYAVNAQNILNALQNTMFSGFTQYYFSNSGYIAGTIDTTPPDIVICPICGQQFSSQAELDTHYSLAHPNEPPPLPTPIADIVAQAKAWINRPVQFEKYTDPAGTPFQAAQVTYRGVPVGLQDEDRFSPMNTPAFLPFAQETTDPYNAFLMALLALIARSPDGVDKIVRLSEKYMDNVTDILEAILEAGKTHPMTAFNAVTAYAVTAHRFGIITDSGYLKLTDQTRSLLDKEIYLSALQSGVDAFTAATKSTRRSYQRAK